MDNAGLVTGLVVGEVALTVEATSGGQTAENEVAITVNETLMVTTYSLPDGMFSVPYAQTLSATGGGGDYTWSVIERSLPAGLSLNASTGEISGAPTGGGFQAISAGGRHSLALGACTTSIESVSWGSIKRRYR